MKPAAFVRHLPRSVDDIVTTLAKFAPHDGRILAGGQSLVPIMAFRMARPAHLIDINEVAILKRMVVDPHVLSIGALVRHSRFHAPVTDAGVLGQLLAVVVKHIAHYPIRMRGTFCGSLAHADPASEWCLVAATLDAMLVVRSVRGERLVAIDDFLVGIMTTSLADDDFLVEARLPLLPDDTRFGFEEFSRRAGDFAMASALVTYRLVDGVMTSVRVGVGGAEDRPRRIKEAEQTLQGQAPDAALFDAVADVAAVAIDPLEDIQTSADYRRDLVRAMVRRALGRSLP